MDSWRSLLHDDPVPWLLERRDPAVRALTLRTTLSCKLERGAYPTGTTSSHRWRQVSVPLFNQADVLFVLRAVDAAGALDDARAQGAVAWLLARQDGRGRWAGRSPYGDRMPSKVNASKRVTLQVLGVLKHAFSSTAS